MPENLRFPGSIQCPPTAWHSKTSQSSPTGSHDVHDTSDAHTHFSFALLTHAQSMSSVQPPHLQHTLSPFPSSAAGHHQLFRSVNLSSPRQLAQACHTAFCHPDVSRHCFQFAGIVIPFQRAQTLVQHFSGCHPVSSIKRGLQRSTGMCGVSTKSSCVPFCFLRSICTSLCLPQCKVLRTESTREGATEWRRTDDGQPRRKRAHRCRKPFFFKKRKH